MARLFKKKRSPVGQPPGSLFHIPEETDKKIQLSVIEYSEDTFIEKKDTTIEECLKFINAPTMTWIEVCGISDPKMISSIGQHFNLHSLVLEDILNVGQRSKLDVYGDQVFIVVRFLQFILPAGTLKDEQVSIIFGPNYLITFFEGTEEIFAPIKDRLRKRNHRFRTLGSDFLAYALLDIIVDYYYTVLEKEDAYLDSLEEQLMKQPKPTTLLNIQKAKIDMIVLRKAVWPMRDVINRFSKLESPLSCPTTQLYLQDVHDHLIQIIDIIEGFRDVVAGMLDIYLSNINIRTNDIMKVLTIVSTIFVPLTFISSLYGMNFEHMPELHYKWSYPLVLLLMLASAAGMILFFRKKKWI